MSIHRTGTLDLDHSSSWGQLQSLPNAQALPTYSLQADQITLGRNADCTICINDKRLSGKHCTITKNGDKISITDLSTNGTFVGDNKIGKNKHVEIKNLDQIWLLTAGKVPQAQTIGFTLKINNQNQPMQQQKEQKQQAIKAQPQAQPIKQEQPKKQSQPANLASKIKDQITCPFCFDIMVLPVTIQPCNHRFCGGCLAQLVNNKKDTCIQCRKEITTAVRDAAFTSIIDDYLDTHPGEKRDQAQIDDLTKKNIFGFDPINIHQMIHGKSKKKAEKAPVAPRATSRARPARRAVRVSSDLSASDDDQQQKCRQCVVQRNGFKCPTGQIHIHCHNCAKLMPQRNNPDLHQQCAICTTYYCNLYFPPCGPGPKLQTLQDRRASCRIDGTTLRGNKFQFQSLRNFLLSKKLNSNHVFDTVRDLMRQDKFHYIMDRKIMKIAPLVSKQIKLTGKQAICDHCWPDLWFQMVLRFRMQNSSAMPPNVRDRPVCYWGINCRTMEHNEDHARKYNHCIFQSRF